MGVNSGYSLDNDFLSFSGTKNYFEVKNFVYPMATIRNTPILFKVGAYGCYAPG